MDQPGSGLPAQRAAPEHATYLIRLGERVRTKRLEKQFSRRVLSERSGVSERFIAHLELGQGNISVLKLKAIADALTVPLARIIDDGGPVGHDFHGDDWSAKPYAIAELFRHADPSYQKAVVELLRSALRSNGAA